MVSSRTRLRVYTDNMYVSFVFLFFGLFRLFLILSVVITIFVFYWYFALKLFDCLILNLLLGLPLCLLGLLGL